MTSGPRIWSTKCHLYYSILRSVTDDRGLTKMAGITLPDHGNATLIDRVSINLRFHDSMLSELTRCNQGSTHQCADADHSVRISHILSDLVLGGIE